MRALCWLAGLCLMTLPAVAGEKSELIVSVGDPAPQFEAIDDLGNVWKSTDRVGKKVIVVYFYPADLTGGCTKQACGYRDQSSELAQAGVEVVGISGDSAANHALFRRVHVLNFALLPDEQGKIARTFGVPLRDGGSISWSVEGEEKRLTRGVTAARWTFIIGLDGRIVHKTTSVDPGEDSRNVLKAVRQLVASTR